MAPQELSGVRTVLITVKSPSGDTDVEVPADLPIGCWVQGLQTLLAAGAAKPEAWALRLLDGRVLDSESTLEDAGVNSGTRLLATDTAAGATRGASRPERTHESIRVVVDGRPYLFPAREIIIGRGASCDIRCTPDIVSRRHLAIRPAGNSWIAADLKSGNGTWISGAPIAERAVTSRLALRLGHPRMGPLVDIQPLD